MPTCRLIQYSNRYPVVHVSKLYRPAYPSASYRKLSSPITADVALLPAEYGAAFDDKRESDTCDDVANDTGGADGQGAVYGRHGQLAQDAP